MPLGKPMILANRYLFNPVYKNFTWFMAPFATVVTRDRDSGEVYSLPMGAYPGNDGQMLIPMSYTREVNWVKNVLVAGGAQIWYKGQGRQYRNPTFISAKDAYKLIPTALTGTYRAFKTTEFMLLDPVADGPVDDKRPMRAVAKVNKSVVNPVQLKYADKVPPMAVVTHTGRRSGKEYKTPVMAAVARGKGAIALPYGTDSDWVRNVVAAGGGTLTRMGRSYRITEPKVVTGPVPTLRFAVAPDA